MISPILVLVASVVCIQYVHSFSSPAAVSPIYDTIQSSTFLDTNGKEVKISSADSNDNKKKLVTVVILPQLGEFDSSEVSRILCVINSSYDTVYCTYCSFIYVLCVYFELYIKHTMNESNLSCCCNCNAYT